METTPSRLPAAQGQRPPDQAPSWLARFGPPPGPLPRRVIWTARGVAALADLLQLGLFPLFGPGLLSPLNWAVDLAMVFAMTRLVGFHWSFAPTFIVEVVPALDLVPTWTAAVLLATAGTSDRPLRAWLKAGGIALLTLAALIAAWLFGMQK